MHCRSCSLKFSITMLVISGGMAATSSRIAPCTCCNSSPLCRLCSYLCSVFRREHPTTKAVVSLWKIFIYLGSLNLLYTPNWYGWKLSLPSLSEINLSVKSGHILDLFSPWILGQYIPPTQWHPLVKLQGDSAHKWRMWINISIVMRRIYFVLLHKHDRHYQKTS